MSAISKEYAAALFDLARETGSEEPIGEGLAFVAAIVRGEPQILDFLSAPNIPKAERLAVIASALKEQVPEYVLSFAQLLCEHGHIREIGNCAADYEELLNAARGLSTARVVSAIELTEDEKRQLQQRLAARSGHDVQLECSVDEKLLGGLVVTLDGKVIDGSLKHRLKEVREVINR